MAQNDPALPLERSDTPDAPQILPFPNPAGAESMPQADAPSTVQRFSALATNIQPVSFRQPALLTAAELRRLRLRHDEFVRSLATRLSIYLRMDFTATVSQLETVTYRRFVERLPASTHLTLFKVESLPGTGILEIPALFSLALLERLLGGAGRLPDTPREITDAEVAVLDHLSQLLLREWCRHVGNLSETAAAVTGHETNARFLQTESVDTNLLVLELGMRMGDCAGTIQLAAGYDMLDPILRQLAPGHATNRPEHKPAASRELPWNSGLDHVQVLLTAAWQGLELPAGRLAQLKIGDILPVDGRQVHNVEIRLARLPKFIGRLGFSGNKRAVELLQPLHA